MKYRQLIADLKALQKEEENPEVEFDDIPITSVEYDVEFGVIVLNKGEFSSLVDNVEPDPLTEEEMESGEVPPLNL